MKRRYCLTIFLVSAGFDAAAGDPIGECFVTPAGYSHMTHQLMALAEGKCVAVLEVSLQEFEDNYIDATRVATI